jgi:hypothetical protein
VNACAARVGRKEINGVETRQPAIVVFVRQKLPARELPAAERIPSDIQSIATDVRTWQFDLAAVGAFLESRRTFTEDLIYAGRSAEFVYHYTDLEGLRGIVSNNDLWLTHSRFSNDDEEITLGQSRAKEAVSAARQRTNRNREWVAYLERVEALIEQPAGQGVYISCFCREDNLLSQWRTYSSNGVGVSLKLNPAHFSFATGPDSPIGGLMRLWGVIYDRDKQRNLVTEVLHFMFGYKRAGESLPFQERARLAADCIEFYIPTFKNADFREENECRLIFTPPPDPSVHPRFRSARGMLVPYYSLRDLLGIAPGSQDRLPIKGARIGPCVHRELNRNSARMLLRSAGYTDVDVELSATPYRG